MDTPNTLNSTPKMQLSFGILAVDKEYMSRIVKVYPQELLPLHTPILDAKEVKNQIKLVDGENTVSDTVTTKNYVEAEYLDLFSNRVYPPDVRKGESVVLVQFSNSQKYWWVSTGRDDHLRRCERYRLAISDDTRYQKEINDDNTYYLELDTLHSKRITISTSRSDGEKHRYMFRIDAKDSSVFVCDDDDNEFRINTEKKQVYMRNSNGCMIELKENNITINAIDDVIIKAGRQIVRDSPVESQYTTTNSATSTTKARAVGIECTDSHVINAPSIGLNGQVAIGNNLSVAGVVRCAGVVTGGSGAFSAGNSVTLKSKGDKYLSYPSLPSKTNQQIPESSRPRTVRGGGSIPHGTSFMSVGRGINKKNTLPIGSGIFPYIGDSDVESTLAKRDLVKVNKYYTDEEKKEECVRLCMEYRKMFRKLYMNEIETEANSNDQDRTCEFGGNQCKGENKCQFQDACDKYMDQYTATDDDDTRSHYSSQPDVDLVSGEGSGSNSPINLSGMNTVRHGAAWEQLCPSIKMLALDIRRIHDILGDAKLMALRNPKIKWDKPLSEAVEFLVEMAYMKDLKGD